MFTKKTAIFIDIRIATLYSGGALTYINNILSYLDDDDIELFMIGTKANFDVLNYSKNNTTKLFLSEYHNNPNIRYLFNYQLSNLVNKYSYKYEKSVFWEPFNIGIPNKLRVDKIIVTIHDLLVYDYPSCVPLIKRLVRKYLLNQSIIKANSIICISDFTRQRLNNIYNIKLKNKYIDVIKEGSKYKRDENYKYHKRESFFITVGINRINKNIETLLEVFNHFIINYDDSYKLYLVGNISDKLKKKYINLINKYKLNNNVIFTCFLTDDELKSLIKKSRALIFPSFYEGFGLPAIESLYLNTPVVCSNNTSVVEIITNKKYQSDPFNEYKFLKCLQYIHDSDDSIINNDISEMLDYYEHDNQSISQQYYKLFTTS